MVTDREIKADKEFIVKHKFESVFSKLKERKDEIFQI